MGGQDVITPSGTEAEVCRDIARRQMLGIAKYGTTVAGNPLPLRDWLQHAYEEVLDQAVYLKRAIQQIDRDAIAAQHTEQTGQEFVRITKAPGIVLVGEIVEAGEIERIQRIQANSD